MEIPKKYSYAFGLIAVILGGILAGCGVFEGRGLSILGFFLFLLILLNTLDKASLFIQIKSKLLLLFGYVGAIVALLYFFYPYNEHKGSLGSLWNRWYVEIIAAAGYGPALIAQGLRQFFDVPIARHLTEARAHYPFTVGFWLFWLLLTITIRVYEKMGQRTQTPMFYLVSIYNFILGGIVASFARWQGIAMAGFSAVMWIYLFLPRMGIPTISKTKWRKREVRKAGKEIGRAQKRMEKVMHEIDKV